MSKGICHTVIKVVRINIQLSILTLNINDFIFPIRKSRLTDWSRLQYPSFLLPPRNTHTHIYILEKIASLTNDIQKPGYQHEEIIKLGYYISACKDT